MIYKVTLNVELRKDYDFDANNLNEAEQFAIEEFKKENPQIKFNEDLCFCEIRH